MILALSLLACTTHTDDPTVDPVDPVDPTPTGTPTEVPPPVVPPLSALAFDAEHHDGHVTFSDHPEMGGWSVDFALVGSGRGGDTVPPTIAPEIDEHRAIYTHTGFTEWYEATDAGTKHGLEITEQPSGTGDLRYVYQISSELFPLQEEGKIVFLDGNDHLRFTYADIVTFDANGDEVPSTMELDCTDGCTISLVVDDTDAVYPLTIDPLAFSNENVLIAPPPLDPFNNGYGNSVDVDGDFAIVGAPFVDTAGTNRGAAFIYTRAGTVWSLSATLDGANDGDQCGRSVAISADRALVGCWTAENGAGQQNRGLGRVYRFNGTNWVLETQLFGPNLGNQRMGWSVDLNASGDRAIMGGWGQSSNQKVGAATIYERSGTTWSSAGNVAPPGLLVSDRFGFSVAISDSHAVVGTPRYNQTGASTFQGRTYFYDRTGATTWIPSPVTSFADGPAANSRFGYSVAAANEVAVIGVPIQDEAHVYNFVSGDWSLGQVLTQLQPAPSDRFGHAVGINGSTITVGASRDDSASSDDRGVGSVVVFENDGSTWNEEVEFITHDQALNNDTDEVRVGWDVAVSGGWVIAGSNPFTGSGSDAFELETAHLFELTFCTAQTGQPGCDVRLTITEVHPDPLGGLNEQFIEIYNDGTSAVQMLGTIVQLSASSFTIDDSMVIGPGEHAVITKVRDSTLNGGIAGVPGMYANNTWNLNPVADSVTLIGTDTSTLATMSYSGFATPAASLQLSHNGSTYSDPSLSYGPVGAGSWCPTFSPRVPGDPSYDFMSPREQNEACGQQMTFNYDYTGSPPASGTNFISLLGNLFTTGNSGEGPLVWGANSSGQTLTITYTGTGVSLSQTAERGYGSSCFPGFTATVLPPGYSAGGWTSLVCP